MPVSNPTRNRTNLTISVPDPAVLFAAGPAKELDEAATKLQKVYKTYRTRRNLADCAVVVEELWWKALDFAALTQSSISFFDVKRPETAQSRWARTRMRVAKVGKGLFNNEKAQKLAFQHWLEAIDPRHRYGHNLHLYYSVWADTRSTQPFFHWLDVGDGKEVNLHSCRRPVLQRQCIEYLGQKEREAYEVIVEGGKLMYRQSGQLVCTMEGTKWIFVLSAARDLYVGQKKRGRFQHSSFLSGAAITAAGRLVATNGELEAVWPYSGHYLPTEENLKEFIAFLEENNVDLSSVTVVADYSSSPESSSSDDHPDELLLSKRVSCKWSSGFGPRIGCVREYPADLQSQALEQMQLSSPIVARPATCLPIPSPRPSPTFLVSPSLACMGLPIPSLSTIRTS